MIRYTITDRSSYPGDDAAQHAALIAQAARLAREGVEYLQVREKDLSESATVALVRALRAAIAGAGGETKLMLNGTAALAQWAGADGVHLSSTNFAQNLQSHHGLEVSASCHTMADVRRACEFATFILFAPVFEKRVDGERVVAGAGLDALREACVYATSQDVPVLALGGVNASNAAACVEVGAAGLAGIRMFQ